MVDNHVYTLGKACSLGPHMLLRQENSDYYNYKFQATTLLFPSNHKRALRGGLSSQGSHIIHLSSIALMQEHHVPELNVQKTVLKSLSLLMNVHWRDGEQLPSMQSTPILQDAIMDCNLAHRQDG